MPPNDRVADESVVVSDNTGGNVAHAAAFNGEEDIYYVRVAPSGGSTLSLTGAASVKGGFSIKLPLSGTPGVEDCSGGRTNAFEVDFTFSNTLAGVGSAATSCGTVVSTSIDGNTLIVNLTGMTCNAQDVSVTVSNVADTQSNTPPTATATMGLLLGDGDGDGSVTKNDSRPVKLDQGKATDATNFREDLKTNGTIDKTDANLLKRAIGTSLP